MNADRQLNVLVYGATGSQAAPTVSALLARGHRPFVFTRTATKAAKLASAGAEIVVGDLADQARLVEASTGMDAVALLIPFFVPNPAAAQLYSRHAIEAAVAARVPLIVWNSSGGIPAAATGDPGIDIRLQTVSHLRASGVPHIILEPTVYAENLLGPWTAPFVQREDRVAYPTPPDMAMAWLASDDMGALVAAAIERPQLAGRSFTVSGIEVLDGPGLARAFSRALGRQISYHALPPAEFGAILDQLFGPGVGALAAAQYEAIWAGGPRPTMAADMRPVLEALPVQMHTMEEWVRKHAGAFANNQEAVYG